MDVYFDGTIQQEVLLSFVEDLDVGGDWKKSLDLI